MKKPFSLAESWVGTPFHHQASLKGVGCDCAGLIAGVAHEYGINPINIPDDYGVDPDPETMIRTLCKHLSPCLRSEADVVLFIVAVHPQHLAFTDGEYLIHAYQPARKVVKHSFDDAWQKKVHSFYCFPEA